MEGLNKEPKIELQSELTQILRTSTDISDINFIVDIIKNKNLNLKSILRDAGWFRNSASNVDGFIEYAKGDGTLRVKESDEFYFYKIIR